MTTTFNSEARYTCNSGYIRIGNEIRFCGLNGEWTGNPPTCVGKETVLFSVYILDHYKYDYCIVFTANCGGLLDPTNGQVSTSGTTEGSIATYSCNNGYHVVGNTSRTCGSNRQWSGNAPTCERKCMAFNKAYYTAFYAVHFTFLLSLAEDCGPLSDPVNGHVMTPNGTTFGFQASYICNEGYFISGSPIRSCEANGVWSGFEPTCMSKYLPTSVVNRQGWRAHFVFRY